MNTIDEIKHRLDIVDIVSEDVKLRRSGKNYIGFCPFHANTRTPAFVVFPESGTWRCFGECNDGGDLFRYVMKKKGWDFKEALESLAERAGVKIEPLTPQRQQENERAEQLRKLLEEAVVFFRHHLNRTAAGEQVLIYLKEKRGIHPQAAETWELGYAPQGWDVTMQYFLEKGYSQNDLVDAGLLTEKQEGGVYDRFRHRLMFPIRDASGKMAGFGGRVISPDDVPKFMNSPQTLLFDKSRILYGLDKARRAIRAQGQAVIVEGYLDVIALHQAGFENTVSPMGTALTEMQMRQLKRYTSRFVMALDPDAAGVKATLRGLEVARDSLDHNADLVFDARGLLHHEARLAADLRVSSLPDNMDPDEIVLRDPEAWRRIVTDAKPIIYHVLDMLVRERDISDPKVKNDIAARILPLVRDVPNPVERDAYRQQVARVLQVDEGALGMLIAQKTRIRRTREEKKQAEELRERPTAMIVDVHQKQHLLEHEVLRYLAKAPEQLFRINRCLQSNQLERLQVEDFSSSEHQQLAEVIFKSLNQDEVAPTLFIAESMPEGMREFIEEPQRIEVDTFRLGDWEKRALEEVIRQILHLRRVSIHARISQLRFLQENQTADEKTDDLSIYRSWQMDLIRTRGLLDKALAKPLQID